MIQNKCHKVSETYNTLFSTFLWQFGYVYLYGIHNVFDNTCANKVKLIVLIPTKCHFSLLLFIVWRERIVHKVQGVFQFLSSHAASSLCFVWYSVRILALNTRSILLDTSLACYKLLEKTTNNFVKVQSWSFWRSKFFPRV